MSTKLVHTNGYLGKDTGKHPVWVEAQERPFVITLTPTADDLSGTMDKTPAEIWAAYKAGYRFEFLVPTFNNSRMPVTQSMEYTTGDAEEPTAVILQSNIIFAPDGTDYFLFSVQTSIANPVYITRDFILTPAE